MSSYRNHPDRRYERDDEAERHPDGAYDYGYVRMGRDQEEPPEEYQQEEELNQSYGDMRDLSFKSGRSSAPGSMSDEDEAAENLPASSRNH